MRSADTVRILTVRVVVVRPMWLMNNECFFASCREREQSSADVMLARALAAEETRPTSYSVAERNYVAIAVINLEFPRPVYKTVIMMTILIFVLVDHD